MVFKKFRGTLENHSGVPRAIRLRNTVIFQRKQSMKKSYAEPWQEIACEAIFRARFYYKHGLEHSLFVLLIFVFSLSARLDYKRQKINR